MLYQTENPHGGDIYGDPVFLDFSANTNPLGTPEGIQAAIADALSRIDRYPDPYCRELTAAIAEHEQLPQEHILCGNGAAELIYSYCEALRPRRALELAPTFLEYSLGLERVGCETRRFLLTREEGFLPGEALLACLKEWKPDAVFLCNPNNPTGRTLPAALLHEILCWCRDNKSSLFVDECFMDLCDRNKSLKGLLAQNPQLFLLKAFTKSYGMAGVRLGYGLTSDHRLLSLMSRTVQPWNVSGLAQAAGVAALTEHAFLDRTRAVIQTERAWLTRELKGLGFWVCPSEANYLLFHAPDTLGAALQSHRIAIRSCHNYHGLEPGWYRIAVRLHEENEILIGTIKQIYGR